MVTIRLSGGLGNQMFQYAFGRAVAEALQIKLWLDVSSGFVGDPYQRSVALTRLPIVADYRVPQLNRWARGAVTRRWPYRLVAPLQNYGTPLGERVYCERGLFEFDPAVFTPARATYFIGYWQNPRYFETYSALLRTELSAKVSLNDYSRSLLERMRGTESVAVHVRKYDRADQMLFKKQRTAHLTLPPAYYEQGVRIIAARIRKPTYFVFSDDPAADVSFLRGADHVRVDARQVGDDVSEQWLMSQCGHQLIANSTFSWWAAWLNENPGKCVIAPYRWFNDGLPAWNVLPSQWQSIFLDQWVA